MTLGHFCAFRNRRPHDSEDILAELAAHFILRGRLLVFNSVARARRKKRRGIVIERPSKTKHRTFVSAWTIGMFTCVGVCCKKIPIAGAVEVIFLSVSERYREKNRLSFLKSVCWSEK